MEIREEIFQYRGKTISGKIAVPSELQEAISALGEKEVFDCFMSGYIDRQRRKLRAKREKRWVKIDLSKLSEDQRRAIQDFESSLK